MRVHKFLRDVSEYTVTLSDGQKRGLRFIGVGTETLIEVQIVVQRKLLWYPIGRGDRAGATDEIVEGWITELETKFATVA